MALWTFHLEAFASVMAWVSHEPIVLKSSDITLSNVLEAAPESMGHLSIARMPESRAGLSLSGSSVAELVRRRVPGLALPDGVPPEFVFRLEGEAALREDGCLKLVAHGETGDLLREADVLPTPCGEDPRWAEVVFDRDVEAFRLSAPASSGDRLPKLKLAPDAFIDRGDGATLSVASGPVRIERDVRLLQGADGARVFVVGEDGQAFSMATALLRPAEERR